jgi:hypothetical protein
VLNPSSEPIRSAVVTILTTDGAAVDWGQADSEGRFSAAIPGPGDYLVVTTADGWRPRTRVVTFGEKSELPPLVLRERLTLQGSISGAEGEPIPGALVILTRHTGELVDTTHTEHDGRFVFPRPTNGRYVLSAVTDDGAIGARPVTVWEAARSIDLALGTPLA